MPELSVVIATYNANATLGLQLEALAHQIDAPAFEVIVVDNASSEAPDGVCAQWQDALDIRVIRAVKAQGVAYARNVGLAAARADAIVFCDADDCAAPGFLRAAADALREAPFLTGAVHTVCPSVFERGYDAVRSDLAARESGLDGALVPVDPDYPVFMGGASAVRRDAAVALGGFDQSYVPGAEDNDFGLRAVASGQPLMRCAGMALVERRRPTAAGALKRSFDGGRMHMRLCAGHDLWATSPHLRAPSWWCDLLRLPLAAVCTAVRCQRGSGEGWHGLAGRTGVRTGQLVGFVTFRVLRRPVEARLGLGFDEGLAQRPSAALVG